MMPILMTTPTIAQVRMLMKEQKKKEITALLECKSPMEPAAIAKAIPDLSLAKAKRYLDELLITGHIRKVASPGKRKNIVAYTYQCAYGTKMDIVSVALSNPLHQLAISVVLGKKIGVV